MELTYVGIVIILWMFKE